MTSFDNVVATNRWTATNAVVTASQNIENGVSLTMYFEAPLEGSNWFFKAFALDALPADEQEEEQ